MQTIACFKGKFGSTEYYQTKMSAGTLINTVGFAKEMSEYSEMTADEKLTQLRDAQMPNIKDLDIFKTIANVNNIIV